MVKRRTVLLGGAATVGALVIGWGVVPPRQRLHTAQPLPQGTGQVALNGWLNDSAVARRIIHKLFDFGPYSYSLVPMWAKGQRVLVSSDEEIAAYM